MDEDPAFYRKFSELLEEAIRAFREKRLADREYLKKVSEIAEAMMTRRGDDLPEELQHHDVAKAFFGVLREVLSDHATDGDWKSFAAKVALKIDEIIVRERIVNWTANIDVQNQMRNEIEDTLHDLKDDFGAELTFDQIDHVLEKCLDIARRRYPL
jgi:type I restriction enzyme R subunit